ncbi:MAG: SlyX family protein [Hyphomicrobiales bacterium]|nr:MAG: SlyX family protein [Hyphomicrobiales bacterium]
MSDTRLDKLEMTIAYQEQAIEDLNKIVLAQAAEIEKLKRVLGNLGERVREIADNPALAEAPEPPPPHY